MNSSRTEVFFSNLTELASITDGEKSHLRERISITKPLAANEKDLLLFHTPEYVDAVKESSLNGTGYLDYGDTPSFKGVYEASLFPVGNTLNGLRKILDRRFDHFFNPVGGLHHARKERAGGFCVFNDAAIVITKAIGAHEMKKVAYVDIDAHHGDGVFYGFEDCKNVIIGDIHEDGRYLYPGTGSADETGIGNAVGTKLNIPLLPGSGDDVFIQSMDKVERFIRNFEPEFIFFQCGADGLEGDPITHLAYSAKAHAYASAKLHSLSHEICEGRLLAMGGGGYNPANVNAAWFAVAEELSGAAVSNA